MTRPASEIQWSPDVVTGRAVWLLWFGAPWDYEVAWGDGSTSDQGYWSEAVKHTYSTGGTYTVTCTPDLPGSSPSRTQVTVRDFRSPQVTAQLLDDRRTVALDVPHVPDPVRWRVDWGDGTVTEHGAEETPGHTYTGGFGKPTITVTDVPSQRATTLTGPEIGPAPQPPPTDVSGWFWRYTGRNRRFVLYGGNIDPGTEVRWSDWTWNQVRTATADDRGQVAIGYDMPEPIYPDWDTWRSYTVQHRQNGSTVTRFVPVHVPRAQAGTPDVVYDVNSDDPQRLEFSVLPAQTGAHHVDFGDGTDQVVHVDEPPLRVSHRYTSGGPFQVRITLPDGRTTETRRVADGDPNPCGPSYNPHYPGRANVSWWFPAASCGKKMIDPFDPVVMQVDEHMPHRHHCPNKDGFNSGYGYQFTSTGWKTFEFLAPLSKWRTTGVTIEKLEKAAPQQRGFDIQVTDEDSDLTAWFGDVTEWDGGYSGRFTVHNAGEQEVPGWQVEFALAEPGVLREAWPRAEVAELGGGRWRISSTTPIPAFTDAVVTARVEPPGKTRKWPDQIHARSREKGEQ